MKGMQKIRRGKSFAGVVLYALKPDSHHKSDPIVIGGNLLGDSVLELIFEFNTSKQLRTDVIKPVWHNSLRLPASERLRPEQWKLVADDYMKRMGFSDTHLRCYVLHDDEAGQHIHIIASRIDMVGGKLYLGRNENLISTRIISELEITHALTVTKATPSTNTSQPKRKRLSRNEEMLEARTSSPCPKKSLQQIIDKILADKPGLETFIKRLEGSRVTCKANRASTGKMNGFSFEYQGMAFKASKLGKKYSWLNLQKHLSYAPEHVETFKTDKSPIPSPLRPSVVPEFLVAPVKISPAKQKGESLTIAEKIASLTASPSCAPSVSLAPTLAPKMVVEEDKRQRIISAVLDLQNSQRRKSTKIARFNSWLILINLLKQIGFSLLHPVRKFKNIFTVHSVPPPIRSEFTTNLKQKR